MLQQTINQTSQCPLIYELVSIKTNINDGKIISKYKTIVDNINQDIEFDDSESAIDRFEESFFDFSQRRDEILYYPVDVPDSLFKKISSNIFGHTKKIPCVLKANSQNSILKHYFLQPYLYYGSAYTAFGLHVEDAYLSIASYNFGPAPKIWYIVPSEYRLALKNLFRDKFPELNESCEAFLRHKALIPLLDFFKSVKIPYKRVVQRKNEMLILWPGVYHFGYNMGPNVSDEVNFALHTWIHKYIKFKDEDNVSKICQYCKNNEVDVNIDDLLSEYASKNAYNYLIVDNLKHSILFQEFSYLLPNPTIYIHNELMARSPSSVSIANSQFDDSTSCSHRSLSPSLSSSDISLLTNQQVIFLLLFLHFIRTLFFYLLFPLFLFFFLFSFFFFLSSLFLFLIFSFSLFLLFSR